MQQKSEDHWRSLGFFSSKLTDTESRYSTFDHKLLAAHAAIKHFCHFCDGRAFQLWTDHKPLVTAISRVSAPISQQQRHWALISKFNVQLLYLPGLINVVANFCPPPNQTTTGSVATMSEADPVDFEEKAAEQNRCPETQRFPGTHPSNMLSTRQALNAWLKMFPQAIFAQLPLKFRKSIFDHFHNVAHPGRPASRRIISSRFVWRGLSSDVTGWACRCLACQRGKIHRHTCLVPQPIPIPIPQRRFSHLHVDLVGPLQYSNNFNYIFTIIDRTSKWMEAIPLSKSSAAACAKANFYLDFSLWSARNDNF
jgi:hypothetical protein